LIRALRLRRAPVPERSLHEYGVEPAAVFEADIPQNADMAEAEGFMEAGGCGLPGRITNDRDHLPEAKRSGPFNERS
jgi:hypothetical protein